LSSSIESVADVAAEASPIESKEGSVETGLEEYTAPDAEAFLRVLLLEAAVDEVAILGAAGLTVRAVDDVAGASGATGADAVRSKDDVRDDAVLRALSSAFCS
jgi:hypothetical protein